MADKLRDEAPFELFFSLLRGAIANALTANLRGVADAAQAQLASIRGTAEWGALWSRLGDIQRETDQHNLDRRQAVVAGLSLLR
jgi:hypothetical protein